MGLSIRQIFIVALLLSFIISLNLHADLRPNEMKVKLVGISPQVFKSLDRMGFKFEDYSQSELYLRVIPAELEQLRKMGYHPEIIISDLNTYRQKFMSSPDYAQYHDYYSTLLLVDSLIAQYPNIINKHIYGSSVLERQLYAVKISDNVAVDENEPEISFDGCHHGDEIMGAEVIIRLMRDLCVQYGNDPQITGLVDNREIWIYPFINPDGRQALIRENNNGVDVNRDWGYMWDQWGGSTGAFSQPETQAAASWIIENQFVLSQSNHGGTEALLYPWSYRPNPSPDDVPVDFIAAGYSNNSGYANLPYSQGYGGLYPINGSAKDNYYGIKGSVGWTLEVSNSKMPPASNIPVYYNYNKPAMLYLIEQVSRGVRGIVTDANSGLPVSSIIWVSDASNEYWPIYTDPEVGDFHKYLLPGNYDIKVTANGYQTSTISNITVVDTGATEVNFQLQSDEGTYGYQVISSQIPGNNYSDEGMTPWALGIPDNKNYSVGTNGWVVLDMGTDIQNYPGNDFRVVEGDASPEGYDVSISNSWLGPWTFVSTGTGTNEFDINSTGLQQFRYVKIEDDGNDNPNLANAGFDLDAVEGRLIPSSGPYLVATNYIVDDSTTNNNGILEAGETAGLGLLLKNLGVDPVMNLSIKLATTDPNLTFINDSVYVGNINSNGTDIADGFIVQTLPNTPHYSHIIVNVNFSADNGYQATHPIVITVRKGARIFTQNDHIQFDPTFVNLESIYPLQIFNNGLDTLKISQFLLNNSFFSVEINQINILPSSNATINVKFSPLDTIQYLDTLRIINNDPVNFNYGISLSGKGILEPDIFVNVDSISVSLQETDSVDFLFSIENVGAGNLDFSAQIVNYSPPVFSKTQAGGGADAFGHVWTDSDDPNGPVYNWIDISDGSGTQIPISGSNMISNVISLGFSFPFYDSNYSYLRVCTNGWISFTTFSTAYNNTDLPDPIAPKGLIAPLWDNLIFQTGSAAFYRKDLDKFIIQWDEVYSVSGFGSYTFEMIIYDNGDIVIQYENLNSIDHSYTVGIQNGNASDGFAIAFNEAYLHNDLAIKILRKSWVSVTPAFGQIIPGGNESIQVRFKTENFPEGNYWAGLEINNNDPDESTILIPIHMMVSGMVGLSDQAEIIPNEIRLLQNYPNPFNPSTTISFQIPEKSLVRMTVYNPLGQVVKILLDKELNTGEYQIIWDSTNQFGQSVPSGIYFYELRVDEFSKIKKMILLH